MLKVVFSYFWRVYNFSFLTWVLLSTIIPIVIQKVNLNAHEDVVGPSLTSPSYFPIRNSLVYFIIGHPDDEVMFFSPTLLEVSKAKYNNEVNIVCFSNGDAANESMGPIRTNELLHSGQILGVPRENITVLTTFKDGMNISWNTRDIASVLNRKIDAKSARKTVLITFDEAGVSNHPNHISLHFGVKRFFKNLHKSQRKYLKCYNLKSLMFGEKYTFNLLTNMELFVNYLSKLMINSILKINVNISFFNPPKTSESIKIYSNLNMLSVSYAAMSYGHYTQMTWFRYGWLFLSRYMTFNQLVETS